MLKTTIVPVSISQTPGCSRIRWFVDVRCKGSHEVWSESNWGDKHSAYKRADFILQNQNEFIKHFKKENKKMSVFPLKVKVKTYEGIFSYYVFEDALPSLIKIISTGYHQYTIFDSEGNVKHPKEFQNIACIHWSLWRKEL